MGFQNSDESAFRGFGNLVIWLWKSCGNMLIVVLYRPRKQDSKKQYHITGITHQQESQNDLAIFIVQSVLQTEYEQLPSGVISRTFNEESWL